MSRERELLKRVLKHFDETLRPLDKAILTDSIRDFLSTPEPEQDKEPVAWMYPDDLERFEINETFAQAYSIKCGSPSQGTTEPLYRHPAPRPEFVRLSEKEIMEIVRSDDEFDEMMWDDTSIRFARAVENRLVEKNK